MKVNKELFRVIRKCEKQCDESKIRYIETNKYNEFFNSNFFVLSFRKKGFHSNYGSKSKDSCIIKELKFNVFVVIYYDGFERQKIKLFPNDIKRVIYK